MNDFYELTPKELEILPLVAEAKTNKEIAQIQCVTVRTVESHIHNLLQRTNCRSRCELIVLYFNAKNKFVPKKRGGVSFHLQIAELFIENNGILSPAIAASRTGANHLYAQNVIRKLRKSAKNSEILAQE